MTDVTDVECTGVQEKIVCSISVPPGTIYLLNCCLDSLFKFVISGVEAGKKAAGEVLALQKRVLTVLNEARYVFQPFDYCATF